MRQYWYPEGQRGQAEDTNGQHNKQAASNAASKEYKNNNNAEQGGENSPVKKDPKKIRSSYRTKKSKAVTMRN